MELKIKLLIAHAVACRTRLGWYPRARRQDDPVERVHIFQLKLVVTPYIAFQAYLVNQMHQVIGE